MTTLDFSTTIGNAWFPAPTFTASGCASSGRELAQFFPLREMGGVVTKSVMSRVRPGRPTPRMAETPSGMLNSIGLANVGVKSFIADKMSFLRKIPSSVIVNVAGAVDSDYEQVVEALEGVEGIDGFEINVSCPNVKHGGMALGTDPKLVAAITKSLRARTKKPLILKLSPNVTDITQFAVRAEEIGADAISAVNTQRNSRRARRMQPWWWASPAFTSSSLVTSNWYPLALIPAFSNSRMA